MDKRLLSIDEGLLIIVDEVVMTPNLFTIIQTKTPGVKQNPGPAVPRRRRGNPPWLPSPRPSHPMAALSPAAPFRTPSASPARKIRAGTGAGPYRELQDNAIDGVGHNDGHTDLHRPSIGA